MKKIIALILVVVLSFGVCSISFASGIEDDNNDYSWELSQIEGAPRIERCKYTSDTSQGCLVDGGQYISNASVTGNKGVTKIIIFMYPQKKSGDGWTNLTTFKDTKIEKLPPDSHLMAEIFFIFSIVYLTGSSSIIFYISYL